MFDHLSDGRRRLRLSPAAVSLSAAAHLALLAWLAAGAGAGPFAVSPEEEAGANRQGTAALGGARDTDGTTGGTRNGRPSRAGRGAEAAGPAEGMSPGTDGAAEEEGRAAAVEIRVEVDVDGDGENSADGAEGRAPPAVPAPPEVGVGAPAGPGTDPTGSAPAAGPAVRVARGEGEVTAGPLTGPGDAESAAGSLRPVVEVPVGAPFRFRAVVHAGAAVDPVSGPATEEADSVDSVSAAPLPPADPLASADTASTPPRAYRVVLRGDGMEVRPAASPRPVEPPDDAEEATRWSWTVVPREPGVRPLRLEVVGAAPDDSLGEETTLAARTVYVAVRPPEAPPLLRWLWEGWRWVAAVLLIAWVVRRRRRMRRERRAAA